jgi:uncharacterized protein YdeI (BOF family)
MSSTLWRTLAGLLVTAFMLTFFGSSPASAQDPHAAENNDWITIDGTVRDVMPNSFTLDYGDGLITVEMDDGDRDADGYKLVDGDQVQVTGVVDDDLIERRTIEASSVYVENLGTHFYASSADEEDHFIGYVAPLAVSRAVLSGTVTDVSENEFTMLTGVREITVEVDEMTYNPLDDSGYQKIEVGDRVSVMGTLENELFEGLEMEAQTVTTIRHG